MAKLTRTHVVNGQLVVDTLDSEEFVHVPKKTKFNNGDFITVFQNVLMQISLNKELPKGALRLLLYLISKTEIDNEVKLSLNSISKEMDEAQGNVVVYFQALEGLNIAVRDRKRGTIRLNYELAYKGKIKEYTKVKFIDTPITGTSKPSSQLNLIDAIEEINGKDKPALRKAKRTLKK